MARDEPPRLSLPAAIGLTAAAGSVGWITDRIAVHQGWLFPSFGYFAGELIWKAWILAVLVWAVRRFDGRKVDAEVVGLGVQQSPRLGYPVVAALVVGGIAFALAQVIGASATEGSSYGPTTDVGFLLAAAQLLVRYPLTVFAEEAFFRGWMQPRLGRYGPVLSALLWAGFHLQQTATIPSLVLFGLLLGFVRWRTGSTRFTSALHYVGNAAFFVSTYL